MGGGGHLMNAIIANIMIPNIMIPNIMIPSTLSGLVMDAAIILYL